MCKKEKYQNLIGEMSRNYRCVKFVTLSMSSIDAFSNECSMFLDMMNDIGFDKEQQHYIIKKMINTAIREKYYILSCTNRNWDSPDFMQFWFFSVFFLFVCFGIIQSQAANCKLPIHSKIYTFTFKNTNKVSMITIYLLLFHLFNIYFFTHLQWWETFVNYNI